MSDNLSPRIIEGRTYSYSSAPVGNFQAVDRSAGWADHRANTIRNRVELMLKAEADGDTRAMMALADQAVGWIMQARDEMEKRGGV